MSVQATGSVAERKATLAAAPAWSSVKTSSPEEESKRTPNTRREDEDEDKLL